MPALEVRSLFDPTFIRTGCTETISPIGGRALCFDNPGIDFAKEYVTSSITLPQGDFSVQFFLRTYASGCNGIPYPEGMLPLSDAPVDPAKRSVLQSYHGGAVLANCNCRVFSTGFSIQVNQPKSYFTVNFQTDEMDAPICLRGMRKPCDDAWHLITVTVKRDGEMCVYCDGELLKSADISAHAGESLGENTVTVGCDAMHVYSLGKVELGEFTITHSVPDAQEIADHWHCTAVKVLAQEIFSRKLETCDIFDQAAVADLLAQAKAAAETVCSAADAQELYHKLSIKYEETLLKTVQPDLKLLVLADTHCSEDGNGRTVAFRNALQWAQELDMNAMLHGGDYTNFGQEEDFAGFWDSMRLHWQNKPFFLTVGNHETLHNDAQTLAKRQCDWLREFNMVDEKHDQMYYEGEVNGHHVLVLAQYYDYEITGYKRMWQYAGHIKEQQMDWIREKVNAYCGQGKPVFLVIHNAHRPLLEKQTNGVCTYDSVILRGDELYDILRDHKDIILCTGHVHHGLGAISGLFSTEGYHVLDIPGFRNATYGRGFDEVVLPAGTSHAGFFAYVFGRTILLRAADFATREWLPCYDQLVYLP